MSSLEVGVSLGLGELYRAAVPEAAVYEDGEALAGEDEVRAAGEVALEATAEAVGPEDSFEGELKGGDLLANPRYALGGGHGGRHYAMTPSLDSRLPDVRRQVFPGLAVPLQRVR